MVIVSHPGLPIQRNAALNAEAAKYACLGWLVAATVSGALVDLGLPFFAFAALACSRIIEPLGAISPGQLSQASALQAEGV